MAFAIAAVVLAADLVTTALAVDHLHDVRHVWGPFGLALTFNSGSNTSVTLYMQMYGSGEDPALSYVQIDDVTLFETAAVDAGSEQ